RETAWQLTPASVSRETIAWPMPLLPPVTTATLPARLSSAKENLDVLGRPLGQGGEGGGPAVQGEQRSQLTNAGTALGDPFPGLAEVSVGVPEDAPDGLVAPDHTLPGERGLVGMETDEDRRPSRRQ